MSYPMIAATMHWSCLAWSWIEEHLLVDWRSFSRNSLQTKSTVRWKAWQKPLLSMAGDLGMESVEQRSGDWRHRSQRLTMSVSVGLLYSYVPVWADAPVKRPVV